jgi:hypothetical protein
MNVSLEGEYIALIALPQLLRKRFGRSPDKRTIKRWRKEGLCGGKVKLQCVRHGLHWYTKEAWLNEFFKQQEAYRSESEAYAAQLQANFRRIHQRQNSRRANREHEAAMERLSKIYPDLDLAKDK